MRSLWRPFWNSRSVWSLEPRSLRQPQGLLVFQWEDSGDEVEISRRIFRKFSNFQLFTIVFHHDISAFLKDARQWNRNWNFFPFWSEIESGPTVKAGRHKSLRTPKGIPSAGVIISKNRLPGFSFTPYISVLRQNLLWLVWPMNLSVFAKTPSERMFLFSVFLSLLPVKV